VSEAIGAESLPALSTPGKVTTRIPRRAPGPSLSGSVARERLAQIPDHESGVSDAVEVAQKHGLIRLGVAD